MVDYGSAIPPNSHFANDAKSFEIHSLSHQSSVVDEMAVQPRGGGGGMDLVV